MATPRLSLSDSCGAPRCALPTITGVQLVGSGHVQVTGNGLDDKSAATLGRPVMQGRVLGEGGGGGR